MPSDKTILKGARLQREGRVHRIDSAVVFTVESTHGTYVVVLDAEAPRDRAAYCTCPTPAPTRCSHIIAATFRLDREREAVAR